MLAGWLKGRGSRLSLWEVPVHQRARLLRAAADLLQSRAADLAREITAETGKVISHTKREASRVPWTLRASASAAGDAFQSPMSIS